MSGLRLSRKILTGLMVICGFLVGTSVPALAQNGPDFSGVCTGVQFTGDQCDPPGNAQAQSSINDVIHRGLEIFSFAVGIIAVAMIIFGGFKYITAGGDSSRIQSAQQTVIYAVIGLVIAAVAQIIAVFVIAETT